MGTPHKTHTDIAAHNSTIAASELAQWKTVPERMGAYYVFPAEDVDKRYRTTFQPVLTGAHVTTWPGDRIGTIVDAKVYPHNFGARMVSLRVIGTNGATYYGRASYDHSNCVRLRRMCGGQS